MRPHRPTVVMMKVSALVLDYTLYPRHTVDQQNVTRLEQMLEAGVKLDPIIAERESHRIVDGFHRFYAYTKWQGPDAQVRVELRDYADDAALFVEAVELNTGHGKALSPYDQSRCISIFDRLQVDPAAQANALHLTPDRLGKLELRKTALGTNASLSVQKIPIKATVRHLAGQQLTPTQQVASERTGGMQPLFYVNQVTNLIEGDLVDWNNVNLVLALTKLRDLLNVKIVSSSSTLPVI